MHPIPPLGDTGIPVAAELEIAEPFEDLLDHRPRSNPTAGVEIDVLIDHADMSVATAVGSFVNPMSAIGISQCFPTAHHHRELIEPQLLTMSDEQCGRVTELSGTARVGEHLGQQPGLSDAQRTGMRRSPNLRRRGQQP